MINNIEVCSICYKPNVSTKFCCGNNKEVRIKQISNEINSLTSKLVSYQNELIQLLMEDKKSQHNEKYIESR
jgi:hypothetical protein